MLVNNFSTMETPTMRRALIFDLDGTLAYTLPSLAAGGNAMLAAYGLEAYPLADYARMVGNGSRLLVRRMLAGRGEAGAKISEDEALAEYLKDYAERVLVDLAPYPGLPELLAGLARQDVAVNCFSNKPDDLVHRVLAYCYPDFSFQTMHGQRPDVPLKPDPTVPLTILRDNAVAAADCIYVGDSAVDMQTAANAGLYSIGVLWGYQSREMIVAGGAQALAATVPELGARIAEHWQLPLATSMV